MINWKELLVVIAKLFLLGLMLFALANFGSPYVKLDNLGDLNVDVAFQLALPYFLEQHFQYGEQVIFTYGPWGILMSHFTGPSWRIAALVFRVTLVISVFLAMCVLADRGRNRWSRIYIWSGGVVLVMLWATGHRDSYFLIPALLVAYQRWTNEIVANHNINFYRRRAEQLLWIVLTLLSGGLALAKFNIFIVSSAAFFLILVGDLWKRRWPILPFTFVASLLTAWGLAGQELSNLPSWVLRCLDLSNGYADAMSKGFFIPYGIGVVITFYSSVVLILAAAYTGAALHRWTQPSLLSLLLTTILCFVAVKHGIGGNQLEQALALLVVVMWFVSQLLLVPAVGDTRERKLPWFKFGVINGVLALLFLIVVAASINFPIRAPRESWVAMRLNATQLILLFRGESTDKWEDALKNAHNFWKPPSMQKYQTIDVYPQHTALVMERDGLIYTPRPAFLSLNAHTSSLAVLNARHLESSKAPNYVLFQILTKDNKINNRYPSLSDGLSWPLLLSSYSADKIEDDFVLLKKRQPVDVDRRLFLETSLSMGETVSLPQAESNIVWAELDLKRSIFGAIIHFIYKSPHVQINVRTKDSVEHVFQVIPEMTKTGFLLSPLVESNVDFLNLFLNEGDHRNFIQTISINSPDAPHYYWENKVNVRLSSINLDRNDKK